PLELKPRRSWQGEPEEIFDLRECQDDSIGEPIGQVLVEQLVGAGVAAAGVWHRCGGGTGPRDRRVPAAVRPPAHYMPPCDIDAGLPSSGICEMTASVVSSSPATDAAFCSAERTTLVGSITPAV